MTSTRGSMPGRSVASGPRPGSLADRLARRPTVLVVEDEVDIAGFLGAYFRASGLDLVHINPRSPEEVLDAIHHEDAVCVLLDLGLTGFSGLDVLSALREAAPDIAAVPVVVVTADARRVSHDTALARGAVGYVTKPFLVKDLFDQVEALVGDQSAGRA